MGPAVTVAMAVATPGSPVLNGAICVAFLAVTLGVVYRVGRTNRTASDYFAAGGSFTGAQNGLAVSGDYVSTAGFLGIPGLIAVYGYDGFLYSIGFLVAWLVALLLVAELVRNTGRFTMGDVLSFRLRVRPVRAAAATSTLAVSLLVLIAQLAAAGALVALLLHVTSTAGQAAIIAGLGLVMMGYVIVGGMRGTTYVQIIKSSLLLVGGGMLAVWVLGSYGFNLSAVLGDAAARSPRGAALLDPGLKYGASGLSKLDFVSLAVALVLGTAGLPHVLMRFYTVPSARQARQTVVWAIRVIGLFCLFILLLGFGAAAVVGPARIASAPGKTNSATPLLAYAAGGQLLLGLVAAMALATIVALVAGLTMTAAASVAHDIYANVLARGRADPAREVRVARQAAVGVAVVAIAGGVLANGQNVAFLVALAFAVAASANLPTILYTLFWPRFNTTGALSSMYGGLALSIVLIAFSPAVSGAPTSMLTGMDFAWFPLTNPALVSVPASFLLGWLGTLAASVGSDRDRFKELAVRSVTAAGAGNETIG